MFMKSPVREAASIYDHVYIYNCICIYKYIYVISLPVGKAQATRKTLCP